MKSIQLVECPRDAMQGWKTFIPREKKVEYINALLEVGFDTIDFGSFVSPKAIPQMADTKEVIKKLRVSDSTSSLLAIVANQRGAEEAMAYETIRYLGFPFSLSPAFQLRNTNSTIEESVARVDAIQNLCLQKNKELVLYLSMGFGNPYGDVYNEDILLSWAEIMSKKDIKIISLADTVGVATPLQIRFALETLIPRFPQITFGVHLHSTPHTMEEKLNAAVDSGCSRIDGALKGIGGCPMAGDVLTGNMNTEYILQYLEEKNLPATINKEALNKCLDLAASIFV